MIAGRQGGRAAERGQPLDAAAPAFFFSDVHLGFEAREAERSKEERLLRFFDLVRASGRSLFCLGDLFDFWFEYETAIPSRYFAVLRRLRDLTEAGVRLYFLGGNHDHWVGRDRGPGFLEREIGFRILANGTEARVGGLRLLLFHGDGLGPQDVGYRILKRVLRNRAAIGAFRWVHPDLARRIGRLTSRASHRKHHGEPREATCARIRAFAEEVLRARPELDAVLAGHAHRAEDVAVGSARYVNLGEWIRDPTYALVAEGTLELRRFEATGREPTVELAAPA